MFLGWLSFLITFAVVRAITHAIRANVGPFHNVETGGGLHIHHLVFGILLLLGVGYLWLLQVGVPSPAGKRRSALSPVTAVLFGIGAALTLDEFALWLTLQDVYWAKQGRDSVDAVVLFLALLSAAAWGRPLFTAIVKELRRF